MGISSEKSFFKSIFSFSSTSKPTKYGNTYWYSQDLIGNIFGGDQFLKDFLEVPELNAIINMVARMESSWKLYVKDKEIGEDMPNNQPLVRLMRTPNWFQGQAEFWKQSSIFRSIYGNEYIYFLTPTGMGKNFKGMFTLDPSKVEIEYKEKAPHFLDATGEAVKYFYNHDGQRYPLEKQKLIHLNDNRVRTEDFLNGTSKIESLQAPIHNIRKAYEKRGIILSMPVGIIGNGQGTDEIGRVAPMRQEEKDKLNKRLLSRGAFPIQTNLAVNYTDMNVNASNMGLFEEVREDTGRLCDAFGVKYEQLASQKGVTFANLKEADKQVYENTIIPNANERIDAINLHFERLNLGKTWVLTADFKHLPVFAEDQRQRATSLKQTIEALSKALADGAITIEQYRTELEKFNIIFS